MGIAQSGVREVSCAHSTGDTVKFSQTAKMLRRMSWITGLFGWVLVAIVSYPISVLAFGSGIYALAITILGPTLLLGSVSKGQMALVQGTRRIGALAQLQILAAATSAGISIGLYSLFGERAIVWAMFLTAAINLAFSWRVVSQISVPSVNLSWPATLQKSRKLLTLGSAFMWGGLLTTGADFAIRIIVLRHSGLEANGIYQAAWGISGMFAGFILGAMGADFYPRLTAVAAKNEKMNLLVNEQTEVGILLALPGLVATTLLTPWLMEAFYSGRFAAGEVLLPWFIIGIFGRVISWPLGYIQLAKAKPKWYAATQTVFACFHVGLSAVLLMVLGIQGLGVAFAASYIVHTFWNRWVSARLCNFRWSQAVMKLFFVAVAFLFAAIIAQHLITEGAIYFAFTLIFTCVSCLVSARELMSRLPGDHRIVLAVHRFSILKFLRRP